MVCNRHGFDHELLQKRGSGKKRPYVAVSSSQIAASCGLGYPHRDRAPFPLFRRVKGHLARLSFATHGGKLLIYHGWADQQVAPGSSIEFYESTVRLSGSPAAASNWIRLFMVPGMGHCGGGEGPDTFDKISVIEQWVEQGKPPARIIAEHQTAGQVDRTRPLCPYPHVARYRGTGNINDASSFTCSSPQ